MTPGHVWPRTRWSASPLPLGAASSRWPGSTGDDPPVAPGAGLVIPPHRLVDRIDPRAALTDMTAAPPPRLNTKGGATATRQETT